MIVYNDVCLLTLLLASWIIFTLSISWMRRWFWKLTWKRASRISWRFEYIIAFKKQFYWNFLPLLFTFKWYTIAQRLEKKINNWMLRGRFLFSEMILKIRISWRFKYIIAFKKQFYWNFSLPFLFSSFTFKWYTIE